MRTHLKMLRKSIQIFLLGSVMLFALFNLLLVLSACYESSLYRTPLLAELAYIFSYFYL